MLASIVGGRMKNGGRIAEMKSNMAMQNRSSSQLVALMLMDWAEEVLLGK